MLTRLDRLLHHAAERAWKPLLLGTLILLACLLRASLLDITDDHLDWGAYLSPWISQYRELGLAGLGQQIGDYYVPYNLILALIAQSSLPSHLLVGLVSCLFEVGMVLEVFFISRDLFHKTPFHSALMAVSVLFLPTVFINGPLWKQCDAIFTFFTLVSVRHILCDHPHRGLIFLGIALSFKLQTAFIFPFYAFLYFKERRFSIFHALWVPAVYLLSGLPAILMGRSVTSTYGTYLSQMHANRVMNINAMNLWALMPDASPLYTAAILLCIALLLIVFGILYPRPSLDSRHQVFLAGWTVLTCFLFLPAMHERYDFAGLVLLYLCAYEHWTLGVGFIILEMTSFLAYSIYLWNTPLPAPLLAVFALGAYLLLTHHLVMSAANTSSLTLYPDDIPFD